MDALTVIILIVLGLIVLGAILWFFLGFLIFVGAASIEDLNDDYPPKEETFKDKRTK
jgi:hypothetical protein